MIGPAAFKQLCFTVLVCLFCTASWAAPKESSVIVEIETVSLTKADVENVISDPIEVLLGSLEGVLLVSAKYQTNKAIIDVRFSEEATDPEMFIKRVKTLIDIYLDKLPDNIDSISVSQVDVPESVDPVVKESIDKPSVIRPVEKRSMAGRFLGSIESSNEFLPIITTLSAGSGISDHADSGNYFMSESDAIVDGELTACYKNTGNVLTCQWRDKYGTGGVDFIFTPNFKSFNGRWSINGREGAYKWSGLKVEDQQ